MSSLQQPVSEELKTLIAEWYFNDGLTMRQVATQSGRSLGLVHKVIANVRRFGSVNNPFSIRTGRPSSLNDGDIEYIKEYVRDLRTIYLDELQYSLSEVRNLDLSISSLSRILQSLYISHKSVQKAAAERNEELWCIWEGVMGVPEFRDPSLFVFLDESAVDNFTVQRKMGWSEVNTPCVARATFLRGVRYSILPALSAKGIVALEIFEGSVTKELFLNFIREQVAPLLNPFPMEHSVVILDNCSIHHDEELRQIIEGDCGARLFYLPPYSPDLNAIEEAFSSIKATLRRLEPQYHGPESLPWLIHQAVLSVSAEDALGWLGDCGYIG